MCRRSIPNSFFNLFQLGMVRVAWKCRATKSEVAMTAATAPLVEKGMSC